MVEELKRDLSQANDTVQALRQEVKMLMAKVRVHAYDDAEPQVSRICLKCKLIWHFVMTASMMCSRPCFVRCSAGGLAIQLSNSQFATSGC